MLPLSGFLDLEVFEKNYSVVKISNQRSLVEMSRADKSITVRATYTLPRQMLSILAPAGALDIIIMEF